jgi:predicted nuclease of predicted toxin-antitoxin system
VSVRLLLDEHLSPTLVTKFAGLGVFAQAVAHVGLAGERDEIVWEFALKNDMTVVTMNSADFLELLDVELHPGLILIRVGGLTRDEQWRWLERVIQFLLTQSDPDFLLNRVVEILGPGRFGIVEIS